MLRPLLISLFLTSTALADTWTVDDDGKADFNNIQAAIDAASDGDEIIVMPGTYTGTGDEVVDMLGKEIWLHSSKGAEVTIIDGEGSRRGIYCNNGETPETIIERFTITNGYVNGNGGGMYNNGNLTLTGCTFTDNTANDAGTGNSGRGGGMYNNGNLTLTGCTFTDNTAADQGGGMHNLSGNSTMLTDCTFTSNTATVGGGMSNDFSSPTLTNCTFTENNASVNGGGMYNYYNSNPTLTDCAFTGNTAIIGGGIADNSSSPTLTNCTFTGNAANVRGGGMWNGSSYPILTNCTFENNTASTYGGGMLNVNSNPTLTDTTLCGNTPDQIYGDWTDNGGNTIADECPNQECPDINGDGYVDVSDLLAIIAAWGIDCDGCSEDVNNDANVDVTDLLIVVGNWGECE